MGVFSKLWGESVLITVNISFHAGGEIVIGMTRHERKLIRYDVLELFCRYYVKSLYDTAELPIALALMYLNNLGMLSPFKLGVNESGRTVQPKSKSET